MHSEFTAPIHPNHSLLNQASTYHHIHIFKALLLWSAAGVPPSGTFFFHFLKMFLFMWSDYMPYVIVNFLFSFILKICSYFPTHPPPCIWLLIFFIINIYILLLCITLSALLSSPAPLPYMLYVNHVPKLFRHTIIAQRQT